MNFKPLYLVELLHPATGELLDADVCARLDVAVQKVYFHLREHAVSDVMVEVSFDEDGEIEGVGFVNEDHEPISLVTTYYLDRDTETVTVPELAQAFAGPKESLQQALNRVFRN